MLSGMMNEFIKKSEHESIARYDAKEQIKSDGSNSYNIVLT